MGIADRLISAGLTNSSTEDISELVGYERKIVKQTFCSSYTCQGSAYKAKQVSDKHVDVCPFCNSPSFIFHKTTSIQLPQIGYQDDTSSIA